MDFTIPSLERVCVYEWLVDVKTAYGPDNVFQSPSVSDSRGD
jgi:hypothetical protein